MRRSVLAVTSAAAVAAIALSSCSSSKGTTAVGTPAGGPTTQVTSTETPITGTVTVLAASSLTDAFTTIAKQFETIHPGAKVALSFGASSALALQITSGAPADVFASASPKNMTQVTSAGDASAPITFVSNSMEIAVPPSNPAHITSVADLAKKGVKVALCQAQVPCGATAAQVFSNAKVTVKPVTEEANVAATLTKVESNEVDAGVVYVTDVLSAGSKVKGIVIPAGINASTAYPIATLTKAKNATGAAAFMAYVLSEAGLAVLTSDGFAKP